ncbi:hypothetical protein HDU81_006038 [Chytriomyces hyalinus]|nr:hypothetical protein HDU81_006038 [Chytriomyces hyalinus]
MSTASSMIVSWSISGKKIVVVGSDALAASRAQFARESGAQVIQIPSAQFDVKQIIGASLVFVCIGDNAQLARTIASVCAQERVPVNVANASHLSDFFVMSTYKDQSLQVAISTNGNGPRIGSKLRKHVVNAIPPTAGSALENLSKLRTQLKLADSSAASNPKRMAFVNRVSETWSVDTLAHLSESNIATLVKSYLSSSADLPKLKKGELRVINAGSGHIDDLTVGAFRALSQSELVLADSSVPKEILDLVTGDLMVVPSDAERPSDSMVFTAIHALELGQTVIRLKAGTSALSAVELGAFSQKGYSPLDDHKAPVLANIPRAVEPVNETKEQDIFHEAEQAFPITEKIVPVKADVAPVVAAAAGTPTLISGQDAAAHVAYALTDMTFVYPVATESSLGKSPAEWSAKGVKNAQGKSHKVLEVSTRTGAAAVVHGAAKDNSAVSVLANSGALSHMLSSMFQISAAKLPVVMHVATQGVNKEFGVYNSVADVAATSFTGFASLGSNTVKESHDLAIVAHVASAVASTPFIHFFDGVRVASEQVIVPVIQTTDLGAIVQQAVSHARAISSIPLPDLVENVMNNLATHVGHHYKLFEYVGAASAETVVVAVGSSATVVEESVRNLAASGQSVGLLKIRLLRPWSARHFLSALPRTVKRIAIIDDSKIAGASSHGPLFLDVTAAFYDSVWSLPIPAIFKGHFAQGIHHFNSAAVSAFLQKLSAASVKTDFTIESAASASVVVHEDVSEAIVWDVQSDRTESISGHAVQLLEAQGAKSVQIFTAQSNVDVEPISSTHIRFSKKSTVPAVTSLISTAHIALVNNVSLLEKFNVALSIREGGMLLINRQGAKPTVGDLAKDLPAATKRSISDRRIQIAVIDADKIAFDYTLFRGDKSQYRNLALIGAFTKLWAGVDAAQAASDLENLLTSSATDSTVYRTQLGALRTALKSVVLTDAPREWSLEHGSDLPAYFEPTVALKKLTGLEQEEVEVVGKAVPAYEPALPILFKEAYNVKAISRPDANEKTFTVKVTENRRLTPDSYERNVFHIEFDIGSSGLKYDIGEALGVYGQNNEDHVDEFLNWYGVSGSQIIRYDRLNEETGFVQSEYKTVAQLFTEVVDIFGKPGKKFYQSLIEHATVMSERERLGFLASGEGADELAQLAEELVNYADVLQMFPSAHPSIEKLLSYIPNIKPRHYSISSSMNVHPTSVHLLVVVVDWKTKSGKARMGQCTRYLVGLRPGKFVTVSVKPSVMKLPPSHEAPVIMAGLGTGMAPFRAFVEERAYQKSLGHKVGPMVLYFGARHRAEEYLYGEELEAYHFDGLLTHLRLAFSRDQKEKVYIQHKIQADATMLGDMILKQGGAFYLCGPTWPVPDVKEALIGAFSRFMTAEEANEKLESLKEEERYVLEVY